MAFCGVRYFVFAPGPDQTSEDSVRYSRGRMDSMVLKLQERKKQTNKRKQNRFNNLDTMLEMIGKVADYVERNGKKWEEEFDGGGRNVLFLFLCTPLPVPIRHISFETFSTHFYVLTLSSWPGSKQQSHWVCC